MRFVTTNTMVVTGILLAAACCLLLTNGLPASTAAPRASVSIGEGVVSPFALMMKAPRDLLVEHYDAN